MTDIAVGETPSRADTRLCKVGGVCMLGAGAIYAVSAGLSLMIGPAPSGTELYLRSVAQHLLVSRLNFGLWIVSDILLLPAVFALYLLLRPVAKRAMLVGSGLLVLFCVFDAAVTELQSLRLVAYAQYYAAANDSGQQLAYVARAGHTLAVLPVATFISYAVSSLGLLIVSVVMLRAVFPKLAAYAGVIASVEGIVGGFYPLFPSLAVFLIPSLIAFALWALLSGRRLVSLPDSARRISAEPDGAANGSQPTRSETNSTSSVAGSRR